MIIKPDTYYWAIYECRLAIIKTSPLNNFEFFAIGEDGVMGIGLAIILKEVSKEELEQADRLADLVVASKVLKK